MEEKRTTLSDDEIQTSPAGETRPRWSVTDADGTDDTDADDADADADTEDSS